MMSWTHSNGIIEKLFPMLVMIWNHCRTAHMCEDGMSKVFCLKQILLWLLQILSVRI